jgi:hypothetical protein
MMTMIGARVNGDHHDDWVIMMMLMKEVNDNDDDEMTRAVINLMMTGINTMMMIMKMLMTRKIISLKIVTV